MSTIRMKMNNMDCELVYHEYEDESNPEYWYWIQYRSDSATRTSQGFSDMNSAREAVNGSRSTKWKRTIRWEKWR